MSYAAYDRFHEDFHRYVQALSVYGDADSGRLRIPEALGTGSIVRTKLRPGMELIVAEGCLDREQTLRFETDVPMVELSFCIQGSSDIVMSGTPLHVRENNSQLAFMRRLDAEMRYPAGSRMLACEIRMAEFVFRELMGGADGDEGWDIRRLTEAGAVRVFQQSILPSEQLLVHQLLSCPYEPPLRKMHMEGKALELLAVYLQRCLLDRDGPQPKNGKGLRRTDLDRVRAAAEMLVAQMDQPPSLLELSRQAGISDSKLKTGFKELYGTTVFGYLRDRRMEQALFLLENERIGVYEAAIAVGYSNPSHFAAVFREKYGFNPGQRRRSEERNQPGEQPQP